MEPKISIISIFYSPSALRAKEVYFEKYLLRTDAIKVRKYYDDGKISKGKARKLIDYYMECRKKELRKRDRLRKDGLKSASGV